MAPKGQWFVWLYLAGRGAGKSRAAAEEIQARVMGGKMQRIALVACTAADARDVMVEGPSGLMTIAPPWFKPVYEPTKRKLTWPNGAIAQTYTAEKPDQLRGPQFDGAWCDEIAKWKYPRTWTELMLGLRIGDDPRCFATTTPRPLKWLRAMAADRATVVTRGKTIDNRANLAPQSLAQYFRQYGGTALGRQELDGEFLDDIKGAMWTQGNIDEHRQMHDSEADEERFRAGLDRIVVAVDPSGNRGVQGREDDAGTAEERRDNDDDHLAEAGIVAVGSKKIQKRAGHVETHGYVLEDVSGKLSPVDWARRAINLYRDLKADAIVVETNFGGAMVEATIMAVDPMVNVKYVNASRGKAARAEPVSVMYQRGLVHHAGVFSELESQLTTWVPGLGKSPDRLDALVWGFTELLLDSFTMPIQEFTFPASMWSQIGSEGNGRNRERERLQPRGITPPPVGIPAHIILPTRTWG